MAGFLSLFGVAQPANRVLEALNAFKDSEGEGVEVFDPKNGNTVVLADPALNRIDEILSELSKKLDTSVIRIFFGEESYWGYEMYNSGNRVDEFMTYPNYWEKLTDEKYQKRLGNAKVVANHWPNLEPSEIDRYLVDHNKLEEGRRGEKAYPQDENNYGDCWQLTDFMEKLALPYPIDDEGELVHPSVGALAIN